MARVREGHLPAVSFGDMEKRWHLNQLSQQRVEASCRLYLGGECATEPSEALKDLLKGLSFYDHSGSIALQTIVRCGVFACGCARRAPLAGSIAARGVNTEGFCR